MGCREFSYGECRNIVSFLMLIDWRCVFKICVEYFKMFVYFLEMGIFFVKDKSKLPRLIKQADRDFTLKIKI